MGEKAVHSTRIALDVLTTFDNVWYLPERDEYLEQLSYAYRYLPHDSFRKDIWRYVTAKWKGQHFPESKIRDAMVQFNAFTNKVIEHEDIEYIAFSDGLYNLRTGDFVTERGELVVTFSLPYSYADIKDAEAPRFKQFLTEVLFTDESCTEHDPAVAAVLQEMFGYCFYGSTEAETAFFLVGNGSNGKSVIAHQLKNIIGQQNITAMSIETLTTRNFATSSLVGKRLNLTGEEESKFIKSDKFKALVSGEVITAERKFGNTFEFEPRAKFIFLTNELPTFSGVNYGITRRLKIIPFYKEFKPRHRDNNLKRYLSNNELPGIIRWALEGATRLLQNNFVFTESASVDAAVREFESDSSSAIRFFRDEFPSLPRGFHCNLTIYEFYNTWCANNGKKPINSITFFRDAKPSGIDVHKCLRFCHVHKKRERGYDVSTDEEVPIEQIQF